MFDKESQDVYLRAMYGQYARHFPCFVIAQDIGSGGVSFVGASRVPDLRYGSDKTHTLIVGEMIIRPHVVVASDKYTGHGLGGLLTDGDTLTDWIASGELIADPMGKFK